MEVGVNEAWGNQFPAPLLLLSHATLVSIDSNYDVYGLGSQSTLITYTFTYWISSLPVVTDTYTRQVYVHYLLVNDVSYLHKSGVYQ